MKESFKWGDLPPLEFSVRPDLGGTRHPYVREIATDRLTHCIYNRFLQAKLTIPGRRDFLHVSLETREGDRYLEAYYNHWGEMTSANLWFRPYCDQKNFSKNAVPDSRLLRIYDQLSENNTDLMLEVDMDQCNIGVYYCLEESSSDNIHVIDASDHDMISGAHFIEFQPDEGGEIEPVVFYINIEDNMLFLGFGSSEKKIFHDLLSTVVNTEKLFGSPTPVDVQRFLEGVRVQY